MTGQTIKEYAEEHDISYNAARMRMKKKKIARADDPNDNKLPFHLKVEAEIQDMSQGDAIDYLLHIIQNLTTLEATEEVPEMTPSLRIIFILLRDNIGKIVLRASIFNALYGHRYDDDDVPYDKTIDVHISKLRKKLPPGYRIDTAWGEGYKMVKVDGAE